MRTKEQKVADKIADLLNDVTLDLDEVGRAVVDTQFTVTYNRLVLMTEAAIAEKEKTDDRFQLDTLF